MREFRGVSGEGGVIRQEIGRAKVKEKKNEIKNKTKVNTLQRLRKKASDKEGK